MDGDTATDGVPPIAVDEVGNGVGVTPGSIGRHVAKRIAPTTATTMMTSGDARRRRGVPPGGISGGSPAGGEPPGGAGAGDGEGPFGAAGPDAGPDTAPDEGPDTGSEAAPVEPPSGAARGVGVRTVGLSSAMSPTVYGRTLRGPSVERVSRRS